MLWHYQRAKTRGVAGNAAIGFNRGVAWAGDRIFMLTDNAHMLALNRFNGELLWETEMADWHQNYNATGAPLPVGTLVVTGSSGGDEGVRGFVAAFDQSTGKEAWRFWTVPAPGEPGSETWKGNGIEHGGAAAWFTGVYDPETDTVFWQAGNPGEETWVRFHLTVEAGIVKAARFKAYGCPHTLAVMEWLTRRLPGRARDEGPPGTPAGWTEELSVPVERLGRLLVIEDA